jgi:hypothetical protein
MINRAIAWGRVIVKEWDHGHEIMGGNTLE